MKSLRSYLMRISAGVALLSSSLIATDPVTYDPFDEFDQMARSLVTTARQGMRTLDAVSSMQLENPVKTKIDIDKGVFRVEAALPGFARENIKATIEKNSSGLNTLTISAEVREKKEEKKQTARTSASSVLYGTRQFRQMLTLPTTVRPDDYTVSHKDGVLIIEFKLDKNKRQIIEVKIDDSGEEAE